MQESESSRRSLLDEEHDESEVKDTQEEESVASSTKNQSTNQKKENDDGGEDGDGNPGYAHKLTVMLKPVFVTVVLSAIAVCHIREPKVVALLDKSLSAYDISGYVASAASSSGNTDSAIGASAASPDPGDVALWAIINASVFIVVIAIMTFALVLLFKYRCYKVLYGLFTFVICAALMMINGLLLYQLITLIGAPVDVITLGVLLVNLGLAGAIGILYGKGVPNVVVQLYLVNISICIAYQFSFLMEWTTWVLLVLLALWDLFAVLTPCGPLKMLVELAQKRQDPIPGLLYSANASSDDPFEKHQRERSDSDENASNGLELKGVTFQDEEEGLDSSTIAEIDHMEAEAPSSTPHPIETRPATQKNSSRDTETESKFGSNNNENNLDVMNPLATTQETEFKAETNEELETKRSDSEVENQSEGEESQEDSESSAPAARRPKKAESEPVDDSVKLGLGDFIFYSLLVSKAALKGWIAFSTCFCVVICGLIGTMILLFFVQKALPALPFSMILGVGFYFLAQYVMDPFFNHISIEGVYF